MFGAPLNPTLSALSSIFEALAPGSYLAVLRLSIKYLMSSCDHACRKEKKRKEKKRKEKKRKEKKRKEKKRKEKKRKEKKRKENTFRRQFNEKPSIPCLQLACCDKCRCNACYTQWQALPVLKKSASTASQGLERLFSQYHMWWSCQR